MKTILLFALVACPAIASVAANAAMTAAAEAALILQLTKK